MKNSEELADRAGYSKSMREMFDPETKRRIKEKIEKAFYDLKFGQINCYMVFPPGQTLDRDIILANTDQEARMVFYTQRKKIPYHVSLAFENASVLDCRPRIVTDLEEAFALGCQFARRTLEKGTT
jgi:hypothetical protein